MNINEPSSPFTREQPYSLPSLSPSKKESKIQSVDGRQYTINKGTKSSIEDKTEEIAIGSLDQKEIAQEKKSLITKEIKPSSNEFQKEMAVGSMTASLKENSKFQELPLPEKVQTFLDNAQRGLYPMKDSKNINYNTLRNEVLDALEYGKQIQDPAQQKAIQEAANLLITKHKQLIQKHEKLNQYSQVVRQLKQDLEVIKEKLSSLPKPRQPLSFQALSFLEEARNCKYPLHSETYTGINYEVLEEGVLEALKYADSLDQEQKTTLLSTVEYLAQVLLQEANNLREQNDLENAAALDEAGISIRLLAAKAIQPSAPLTEIAKFENVGMPSKFYLAPFDTSLIKNQVLLAEKRSYTDGRQVIRLEGKVQHHCREAMQNTMGVLESNPQLLINYLPKEMQGKITISEGQQVYYKKLEDGSFSPNPDDGVKIQTGAFSPSKTWVLELEGVGKVIIGDEPGFVSEYNHITIELDPKLKGEEAVYNMHILLSVIGLGVASSSSRPEDEERIKVLQLFRAYYPKEAYQIERDFMTFHLSLDELKESITNLVPKMREAFKRLAESPDLMYQQEIYPGRYVWAVRGLADEAKKNGAYGLMAGINSCSAKETVNRLVSILKEGPVSTFDRLQNGLMINGASSMEDLRSGGGDSVFTRMITAELMTANIKEMPFAGHFQVLYDIELIERGGHGYDYDNFGTKKEETYKERFNVIELINTIDSEAYSNEFCVRNRIPPRYIRGIVAQTDENRQLLLEAFRAKGVITQDDKGQEFINNVPVDQFIHLASHFTSGMWPKLET